MTTLTVSPAATDAEVDLALELALSVFAEESGMSDYAAYKAHLWREDPSFRPGNLLLGRIGSGPPNGMVRIVPRTIFRGNQAFSVAGISSVCLEPEKRGKGLSVELMQRTLAHCRDAGFDFAFLFARRAADHYYTRFGFWGIASYSRLAVRISGLPLDASLSFGDADPSNIPLFGAVYEKCYAGVFGRVERSPDYWMFLLRRLQYFREMRFSTLLMKGNPTGYVLWSDTAIHEVAFSDANQAKAIVALLADSIPIARSTGLITFELPPQHGLVSAIYGVDMTLSARECTYGGHMACVLNTKALLSKLAARAPASAAALTNLADFDEFSHRNTCRLLGAWSPSDAELADGEHLLPFNICIADQF